MSNFHPLEVVGRGSETQLQVGENVRSEIQRFNPLYPYDASKHHIASLKYDFLHLGLLKRILLWIFFNYNIFFLNVSPNSSHLHLLQVEKVTMVNYSGLKGLHFNAIPKTYFCIPVN